MFNPATKSNKTEISNLHIVTKVVTNFANK